MIKVLVGERDRCVVIGHNRRWITLPHAVYPSEAKYHQELKLPNLKVYL